MAAPLLILLLAQPAGSPEQLFDAARAGDPAAIARGLYGIGSASK
jgi:hypothetical protein